MGSPEPGNYHQIQDLRYTYLKSKHGKLRSLRMGIYMYLNVFPPKRVTMGTGGSARLREITGTRAARRGSNCTYSSWQFYI